jgi:hypothetical protein
LRAYLQFPADGAVAVALLMQLDGLHANLRGVPVGIGAGRIDAVTPFTKKSLATRWVETGLDLF